MLRAQIPVTLHDAPLAKQHDEASHTLNQHCGPIAKLRPGVEHETVENQIEPNKRSEDGNRGEHDPEFRADHDSPPLTQELWEKNAGHLALRLGRTDLRSRV